MDYSVDNARFALQSVAARNVDKFLAYDSNAPSVVEVMGISSKVNSSSSGHTDNDYPNLSILSPALNNIGQIKTASKVPLPGEILERFNFMQCNSMMGLFTEINRAWLTIDSDIYVWTYEEGADVAYYDGLNDTILCVGLIRPRDGVFQNFITHLLVLTTAIDIVVLGVTFAQGTNNAIEEIQLVPDPIFTISTDGSTITTIVGTDSGRLFLGSKDGSLFEIVYQAESSWFGKRCKKVNHSTTTLSFLVPAFLNAALSEEDAIADICVDNSRHILYVLTEKGSISVYDLGDNGNSLSKVIKLNQTTIVNQAVSIIKSLDSQNFYPIVSISAVEATESILINVVAVSQTGVRFYFTCSNIFANIPNQRPLTLTLFHVRLPPGYSATVTVSPRMVHMANYRQSNLMLVSNTSDRDTLWCISSDMFPFYSSFTEGYTTINLDGPAWAMAEVKQRNEVIPKHPNFQTPLVVRQHYEPPRKFVVLTAQGAHIFHKLRPVDMLRQLLTEHRGPENDAVKGFFMILKDDQACAMSLILACLENVQNVDLAEWATQAFFVYGGEPKIAPIGGHPNQHSMALDASTSFVPNIMSTPVPPHIQPQQLNYSNSPMDQSHISAFCPFIYSAKHNGLYLYLGRILRPIWNNNCVEKLFVTKNKHYFVSSLPADNCTWILSYLTVLRTFLQRNTRLTICNSVTDAALQSSYNMTLQSLNTTRLNQTVQDAQLEERQSLEAFKYLLGHCCQVLGLWRILCEHQFHIIVEALPDHYQKRLENTTFKDLILSGHEICTNLINILINSYLSDNAAIDSISLKLRDICPDLYKNEDAACSKVFEMLKVAKTVQNADEKEELLLAALHLIKSVLPNINLHEICQQFASLNAYHAATDICVTSAKKIDPNGVGEYFYNNNTNTRSQENFNYYTQRMKIYKELLLILDNVHGQMLCADNTITLGPEMQIQKQNEHQEKFNLIQQVIQDVLTFDDELLHIAIYEWMIAKKMDSEIIKIKQSTLEKYLIKDSQQSQNNTEALNLLWKYYESCANHAAAAKILHNLATNSGNGLTLKERLGHLARAVMCMRSETVGYAPQLGVFLRDLEDKMEMAKVQDQVLDAILNLQGRVPDVDEAIAALNNGLYDLTQLYEEFADNFRLWECKLAIIDCAGYSDVALVEFIWQNIIDDELKKSSGSGNDKMLQILHKVIGLIRRYKVSTNCVPLAYIIPKLEMISIRVKADSDLVPTKISEEVAIEIIIQIYNDLISMSNSDRFWNLEENELHLAEAFAELVNKFLANQSQYNHNLKTKIKAPCEDAVAKLLSMLYSKPNADQLINILKGIQARLSKV